MRDQSAIIEFYRKYAPTFVADEPAYAEVCLRLCEYRELADLLAGHDDDAQQPNLLFAAVHYLLLGGVDHPLAEAYRTADPADVPPLFAEFVLDHADAVNELLATRRTQTNEVGRSAVLSLMLHDAHQRADRPLAWIDLGTSGGLNLNLDRFRIDYDVHGEIVSTGRTDAALTLNCEVRGAAPEVPVAHADIAWRIGIDRAPIDVTDPNEARWLQACLWPNRVDRHDRLAAAIEIATQTPSNIITGDAADGLREALQLAPSDAALVLTTTWVWYYLPESTKREVLDMLAECDRPASWYSLEDRGVVDLGRDEPVDVGESLVGRVTFDDGKRQRAVAMAQSHPHGAWIDWWQNR